MAPPQTQSIKEKWQAFRNELDSRAAELQADLRMEYYELMEGLDAEFDATSDRVVGNKLDELMIKSERKLTELEQQDEGYYYSH